MDLLRIKNKVNNEEAVHLLGPFPFAHDYTLCGLRKKNTFFFKVLGERFEGKEEWITCELCKDWIKFIFDNFGNKT